MARSRWLALSNIYADNHTFYWPLCDAPRELRKNIMRTVVLFLWLSLFSTVVSAVERHALIIGNSNYQSLPLSNPENDANDMTTQLSQMGYKIHGGGPALDLDRVGIERTVRAFAQQLPEDAHALFYYAGHGIATKTDNYLVPIKHQLEFQEQLPDRTVSLRSIVDLLKNANPGGINVVLLDACRDNPLGDNYRSTRAGLNRLNDIPRGVFIGYAADSGQVAEDGIGRNGTYTEELLNVMREQPNVIIEIAHKQVASRVYEKTKGKQFPVSENKVYGNWCFGSCSDPIVTAAPKFAPTDNSTSEAAPAIATKNTKRWLIVGGAVAAAVVIGLVASNSSDPDDNSGGNFVLELSPP